MMRVVHVTDNIADKTLTIPSSSLGSMNADFKLSRSLLIKSIKTGNNNELRANIKGVENIERINRFK